jgi:FkbM family methyltransferase
VDSAPLLAGVARPGGGDPGVSHTDSMIDSLRRFCGYSMPRLGLWAFHLYFRLAPSPAIKELFPGIRVKLDFADESCRAAWWNGFRYEAPLPDQLRRLCSDGVDAFFDIGANIGFFSYLVLAYCKDIEVFAFEPNPINFALLLDAKGRNLLDRFHPLQIGLADAPGELELTVDPASSGHSTLAPGHPDFERDTSQLQRFKVPVCRFDAWLSDQHFRRDFRAVAKIDIEGFEVKALAGMTAALHLGLFKALIVEVNAATLRECRNSPVELREALARFGYFPHDLSLQPTEIDSTETRNLIFIPRTG